MNKLNVEKYMQIPFVDGGRSFNGCDCRGLVGLIIKEKYSIDIPDTNVACSNHAKVDELIRSLNNWERIQKPKGILKPCILLMQMDSPGIIDHMGLFIGYGEFIHTCSKFKKPSINRIKDYLYFIEGYYAPSS